LISVWLLIHFAFLSIPSFRDKNVDFHIAVNGDCIIKCYAGEVRQVLLNVVRKACEAVTRPGPKVTVAVNG
jgi:hypothetical protein